jgi:uncharacterized protein (TIGR00251 family)
MFLSIKIIPNSKKLEIEKLNETSYRIKLNAPPRKGKANEKLIEVLSKYFNVPKSSVAIATGSKHRNKIVEIR